MQVKGRSLLCLLGPPSIASNRPSKAYASIFGNMITVPKLEAH
jgi:hypothetical protein